MNSLEQFIDKLIQDKNLPPTDPAVLTELKYDLMQRLMDQIDRAAIEALPEEKAVELSGLLDKPEFGEEQLTQFMQNSGVDMQKVALETMLTFRALYLSGSPAQQGA